MNNTSIEWKNKLKKCEKKKKIEKVIKHCYEALHSSLEIWMLFNFHFIIKPKMS